MHKTEFKVGHVRSKLFELHLWSRSDCASTAASWSLPWTSVTRQLSAAWQKCWVAWNGKWETATIFMTWNILTIKPDAGVRREESKNIMQIDDFLKASWCHLARFYSDQAHSPLKLVDFGLELKATTSSIHVTVHNCLAEQDRKH